MAKRYIKLYEQITGWEWFQHPPTLSLFIYLLCKANYCDRDFHGRMIHRGQLVTSLPKLATGTGLTIRQTRTALEHLKSTGEVTDESSNQNRIITIVRYDEYQTSTDELTGNRQATDRRIDRQSTDESTPSIEYIEYKEMHKKDKKDNKFVPPSVDEFFDAFWKEYPKKVKKPDAIKAWKKISLLTNPHDVIEGVLRWKKSDQWTRDGGRFIPNPATWLNARQWEDEVQETGNTSKQSVNATDVHGYEQRDYSGEQKKALERMMQDDWGDES